MVGRDLRPDGGPVRTCVGCRRRSAKPDLVRVVAVGTSVVADPAARMPGRGAYLHPDLECLAAAERRRAFGRALRVPAPLDTTALHDALAGAARSEEPPPRAAARSVRPVEASGAPRGASTGSVRRQVEKR